MSNKVIIGLPTYDGNIRVEMAHFLAEAQDAWVVPVIHKPIDVARNWLVKLAYRERLPLIMVDADAAPAPGTFAALVEKVSEEICVAGVPYVTPGGHIYTGDTQLTLTEVAHLEGWHPTDNLSTHTVAYHWQVFDNIFPPIFEQKYNHDHTSWAGEGEDTRLHRQLREQGIPLYCNWSLWSSHFVVRELRKPKLLSETEKFLIRVGLE